MGLCGGAQAYLQDGGKPDMFCIPLETSTARPHLQRDKRLQLTWLCEEQLFRQVGRGYRGGVADRAGLGIRTAEQEGSTLLTYSVPLCSYSIRALLPPLLLLPGHRGCRRHPAERAPFQQVPRGEEEVLR